MAVEQTQASDGKWYGRGDFLEYYGYHYGKKHWDELRKDQTRRGKRAMDGKVYSEEDFDEYYGLHSIAEATASERDSAAASGSAAEPGQDAGAEQTVPVLLTGEELEGMTERLSGGKACEEQRRLRAQQLASTEPYESVDMTSTQFNWRAMLKSLPCGGMIVGCGVTAVHFRLLPDVMDHNYMKKPGDSGEKHVFEIVRADASRVLLHFHKKGKCDTPEVIPATLRKASICAAKPDHIGVDYTCEPATTHEDIVSVTQAGECSAPLGRGEAGVALQSLLIHSFGKAGTGAINVTDGVAFPWSRYLKNMRFCKEHVGPGIQRVYAVKYSEGGWPMLLLCRADGSYVDLCHQSTKNVVTTMEGKRVQWRELEILKDATYIDVSWMQIRQKLVL